jgi:hypothetical protein
MMRRFYRASPQKGNALILKRQTWTRSFPIPMRVNERTKGSVPDVPRGLFTPYAMG